MNKKSIMCYQLESQLYALASIKIDEIIKEVTNNPNDSRKLVTLEKIREYIKNKRLSFQKRFFVINRNKCLKQNGEPIYGGHFLWCPCDDHKDDKCFAEECRK